MHLRLILSKKKSKTKILNLKQSVSPKTHFMHTDQRFETSGEKNAHASKSQPY